MKLKRAVGLEGSVRRASARRGRYRFERPVDAWRRRARSLAIALVLGGLAARLMMPSFIGWQARRELQRGGWTASIERTRLALWRASWSFEGLRLSSPDGAVSLEVPSADLSLSAPSFKLGRTRARLHLDEPRLKLSRAVDLGEAAARLRALASDSVVEWSVAGGRIDWPAAKGGRELIQVHGRGWHADGKRPRGHAELSARAADGGAFGLAAGVTDDGLILRAGGGGLPGRFSMALETGEGGHLLSGGRKGELQPEPLSIPGGAGRVETAAAALSQALEAARR